MNRESRRSFLKGAAGAAAIIAIEPELFAGPTRLAAPVKVGLIGSGRQGRAILGELAKFEDVTVAALCDTDESRLRSGMRRAQGATSYASHAELLDKGGVDAVIVATPTHAHEGVAIAALQAGKHVYCEGPLAHTVDSCRNMAAAARGAKGIFQTGMQGRSNPSYGLARSFFRSGSIRDLVAVRAQYAKKTSWRTPANDAARAKALNWRLDPELSTGLVGEIGTHQLDVMHWFTGKYPTAVTGSGGVMSWDDGRTVPDTVHCTLEYPGGVMLSYSATLANSYEGQYELFHGNMGSIKLAWTHGWLFKEADAPTQGWEVYANRQQFHNDEGITLIADATKLASQGKLKEGVGLPNSSLYYALEDFLKSVTEEKPVVCTAGEGLRAAVIGIQANRAITSGKRVVIEESMLETEAR